ncbi:MAG TPA: ethanolamine ammonia-lyase subunit EutC [Leptospiraceae bacterium]|nr:ethanolamine ammonia-lyase subunit EutC [Leptospiraceae bacterium]
MYTSSPDSWEELKKFTDARIALGHTGAALPTKARLEFQLAHAMARDAVHAKLNFALLEERLKFTGLPVLHLHTEARDRHLYLKRPDLGRRLSEESAELLKKHSSSIRNKDIDLCIIVGDGLSSYAVERNVPGFLKEFLASAPKEVQFAPIVLAEGARVALSDEIGEGFGVKIAVMLIGERPGLSSPDSLGLYFTYGPRVGKNDADRNCISNIRPEGLDWKAASEKAWYLLKKSFSLKLSGVNLKDDMSLESSNRKMI